MYFRENSKYKRPELEQAQYVLRTGQSGCTTMSRRLVQDVIVEIGTVSDHTDPVDHGKGIRFYPKNNRKSLEGFYRELI